MNKGLKFTLLIFIFGSCRSIDSADVSALNSSALVNVNLLGVDFNDSPLLKAQGGSKNDVVDVNVQRHQVLVNPSTLLVAEMTSDSRLSGRDKHAGIVPSAMIVGEQLNVGAKFRVIAYRERDGSYYAHQDYIVGQKGVGLMLDNGVPYIMVIYSYGTNNLPVITNGEITNVNNAEVSYDDSNRDFMYQRLNYTPINPENILNIKLRHKLSQITTIIKTGRGVGTNISAISNASIKPHYVDGVIPLSSGNIGARSVISSAGATVAFSSSLLPANVVTSGSVLVNAAHTGTFSADVTIDGITQNISVPEAFSIIPERKRNLNVSLLKCGAYTALGVWRNFMCYNLGADTGADPFTPSPSIHGAKYLWGNKNPVVTQLQDQQSILFPIVQNNSSVDSWSDSAKSVNDPCPSGYRLPTLQEWRNLLNISVNPPTIIGPWDSQSSYGSGILLGDYLFLPAAGRRDASTIIDRGLFMAYWTSTAGIAGKDYAILYRKNDISIRPGEVDRASYAVPVRCIGEP